MAVRPIAVPSVSSDQRGTGGDAPATWVAAFHRGASAAPQIERLNIAVSADGVDFRTIAPDFTPPSGTVRDPQVFKLGALWYVVYTSIAFGNGTTFGLASSPDLITWTHLTAPSVAGVSGATQVWAPTPFFDSDGLHILATVNATGGQQIYEMHPSSTDLATATWSTPVKLTGNGSDMPASVIDGQVLLTGSTYRLFAKENSSGNSYIVHLTATALTGPYTSVGGPTDWGNFGAKAEAPAAVDMGASANPRYRVYYDRYERGQAYYSETNDFSTWTTRKRAETDLPHPRHFAPRLVGDDASLRTFQQRIDRNPVSGEDLRQAGIIVPNHGWSFGTNQPTASQQRVRAARFVAPRDMTIKTIRFLITTAATNNDPVDVGIYDEDFNLIGSSGSTLGKANSASNAVVGVDLTTPTKLKKNRTYYAALAYNALGAGGTQATLRSMSAPLDADYQMLGNIGLVAAGSLDAYSYQAFPLPSPLAITAGSFLAFRLGLVEG